MGDGALVGFELDVLPAARYLGYQRRLPGYRLGDCSQALRSVRAVKTGWELERMRAAAEQVRAAARAVPALLRAGVSEATVQLEVEKVLRGAGHQGQLRFRGFNQEMHYGQVLCGPSGAVPGYSDSPLCGPGPNPVLGKGPDGHVLAAGDPVIVDLVGGHEGYLADQTRTFALGPLAADLRARLRRGGRDPARGRGRAPAGGGARRAVRAGRADGRARPAWASISWASAPAASASSATAWAWRSTSCRCWRPGSTSRWPRGNVIAVEPKFVFPGRGAVGIENMYAVTADGFETITTGGRGADRVMSVRHPQSEEQQLLIEAVRTLARDQIAPHAAEVDKRAEFPWDAVELLRENDVFALGFAPGVRRHRHRHADLPARGGGAELGRRHRRAGAGGAVAGRDRDRAGGLARSSGSATCRAGPAASGSAPTR